MALSSCPPPAGSETAAEGEGDLPVLVLAPSSKWHYDNGAVVFTAKLRCLLSDHVGGLSRVVALADEVADLLAVHHEVDAVGGQDQEAVVRVLQLQQRHTACTAMRECCKARELPPCFYTLEKHFFSDFS